MIFILRAGWETHRHNANADCRGSVKRQGSRWSGVLRESGLDRKCPTHGTEEASRCAGCRDSHSIYYQADVWRLSYWIHTLMLVTRRQEKRKWLCKGLGVKWWNIIKCLLNQNTNFLASLQDFVLVWLCGPGFWDPVIGYPIQGIFL